MSSSGTILLIEPEVAEGDEFALRVSYGYVEDGDGLENLKAKYGYLETLPMFGPDGRPLGAHVCKQVGLGPIFIADHIFFGPIFVTEPGWVPLHCDECARIVVRWFTRMQVEWLEKYHGEWWTTYGSGECQGPQRLN